MGDPAPDVMDIALQLLDRQIIDRDGRMAGKVDDIELQLSDDGPPFVSALIAGPGALAGRSGGRLGHALGARRKRACGDPTGRIGFELVVELGPQVRVRAERHELDSLLSESWVREHVIAKIPGAGDETR